MLPVFERIGRMLDILSKPTGFAGYNMVQCKVIAMAMVEWFQQCPNLEFSFHLNKASAGHSRRKKLDTELP